MSPYVDPLSPTPATQSGGGYPAPSAAGESDFEDLLNAQLQLAAEGDDRGGETGAAQTGTETDGQAGAGADTPSGGQGTDGGEFRAANPYSVSGLEEFLAHHNIDLSAITMHKNGVRHWGSEELPMAVTTFRGDRFAVDGLAASEPEQVGGDIFQFHNPKFVEKDGVIHAYFIDHSGEDQFNVGLATSTDGKSWEYQGQVLTRGDGFDSEIASFPAVAYDQGSDTWYMLYQGQDANNEDTICLATSADGRQWDKQGPVVRPGDAGWVSSVDVGTPTLHKEGDTWHVYFHALAEDGRARIGHASGQDLANLSVDEGAVLDVDSEGAESQTVGNRSSIFERDGWYYMVYETSDNGTYSKSSAVWGLNLARAQSLDGPWQKLDGPLLQNSDTGFGHDGPEVLEQDGELYVYYRGQENTTWRVKLENFGEGQLVAQAEEAGAAGEEFQTQDTGADQGQQTAQTDDQAGAGDGQAAQTDDQAGAGDGQAAQTDDQAGAGEAGQDEAAA
jgi:hypothetical protein